MKKTLLILAVAATALMTSCVNNKEMIYLQGADSIYANTLAIDKNFQLLIQSDDELAISITSRDKQLIEQFNNSILVGSGNSASGSSQAPKVTCVRSWSIFILLSISGQFSLTSA